MFYFGKFYDHEASLHIMINTDILIIFYPHKVVLISMLNVEFHSQFVSGSLLILLKAFVLEKNEFIHQ